MGGIADHASDAPIGRWSFTAASVRTARTSAPAGTHMMHCSIVCPVILAAVLLGAPRDAGAADPPAVPERPAQERPLPPDPYRGLNAEQLYALLDSSDVAVLAFRVASMTTDTKNPLVCSGLRTLWLDQQSSAVPAAARRLAKQTQVRIPLAATLSRCEGTAGDDPGYRDYLIEVLRDERIDAANRMRAAANLGIAGDDRDIALLRKLAMDASNIQVAIGAVGGLSAMKSDAARGVLAEIASSPGVSPSVSDAARRMMPK